MPVLIHFYDKPALCRYLSILHRYVYTHIYTYLCTYIYFPEGMFTYFCVCFCLHGCNFYIPSNEFQKELCDALCCELRSVSQAELDDLVAKHREKEQARYRVPDPYPI